MSRNKAKGLIVGISFLVVVSVSSWILGPNRDASSTSKFHTGFVPDGSFRGQIIVTIIEREAGPERNLQFLIDLDRGETSASPDPQFGGPLSPGGKLDDRDCARAVEIPAPDHELAAHCTVKGSDTYTVGIRNVKSNGQIREWSASKGWAISGLIWSPDSKSIAVLLERGRMDLDPIGLISLVSGHPISLETFKVTLLSNHLDHRLELPVIRKDSPSGWARVDWIR
jgi:hypothetical protein